MLWPYITLSRFVKMLQHFYAKIAKLSAMNDVYFTTKSRPLGRNEGAFSLKLTARACDTSRQKDAAR